MLPVFMTPGTWSDRVTCLSLWWITMLHRHPVWSVWWPLSQHEQRVNLQPEEKKIYQLLLDQDNSLSGWLKGQWRRRVKEQRKWRHMGAWRRWGEWGSEGENKGKPIDPNLLHKALEAGTRHTQLLFVIIIIIIYSFTLMDNYSWAFRRWKINSLSHSLSHSKGRGEKEKKIKWISTTRRISEAITNTQHQWQHTAAPTEQQAA